MQARLRYLSKTVKSSALHIWGYGLVFSQLRAQGTDTTLIGFDVFLRDVWRHVSGIHADDHVVRLSYARAETSKYDARNSKGPNLLHGSLTSLA